ncbi:MAG: FG-GAP-like repeat-containing protein [Mariprofundales bacterium]|nr:FG-GAP-like repeat-containing protein [Mariprofundales bacterium]
MNKGSMHPLYRIGCALALVLTLTSCRTMVPEPTISLENRGVPHPSYAMRLVGPQLEIPSFSAKFVDLNQDGKTDILVGKRGLRAGFTLQVGDGAGRWRSMAGPKTSMQPRDFDVADVNRDGQLSVVICGQGDTKGIEVWTSEGTGWRLHSTPIESGIYRNVRFADINADGWPDIVATKSGFGEEAGGIDVWLNDGRGGWRSDTGPMHQGNFVDMKIADLDGDGHLDIIAAERGGVGSRKSSYSDDWHWVGGVRIWYGDGEGRWTQEVLPVDADVDSVTIADVNGDHRLDVIAGLYQHGLRVWLQSRKGYHGRNMSWMRQVVDGSPQEHALSKSSIQGKVLNGHPNPPGYNSRLADQNGEWRREAITYQGTWHDVRVGDLNNDGHQDLVAASSTGQGLALWSWSQADARFETNPGQLPNYGVYYHVDLGDVFNTGMLDVLGVRENGGVEVWSYSKSKPETTSQREEVGLPTVVHFGTALASLTDKEQGKLAGWLHSFGNQTRALRFALSGHADRRPIHERSFPNNRALSRARADTIAAWLEAQGIPKINITTEAHGAKVAAVAGDDPTAWAADRRVLLHAYHRANSARLPKVLTHAKKRDLFHISHNAVFKTYRGITDYIVGPGDKLSFTFWVGGTSTTYLKTVGADGRISLPYLNDIKPISGMSVMETGDYLLKEVHRYEHNPRVDVVLIKALSKSATIFGEVMNLQRQPTGPGTYYLKGKESLVDFIARTGGPTKSADMTKVQLIRHGKTILLNLTRAIQQSDWSENAIVTKGDTIFIPSRAQSKHLVFVLGAVGKPGIVQYIGNLSFLEAVSRAGGFTKASYKRDVRVVRQNRDSPQIIPINFSRFMHDGDLTQNILLKNKDVIIVPDRPIANWNKFIAEIQPTITIIASPFLSINSIDFAIKALKTP